MTLEALLSYAHILAILTMTVFLASEAALCRTEWLNAAVVERLAKIDMVYGASAIAVLITGAARVIWGAKGMGWYLTNPLLHVKFTLFIVMGLLSIGPTLAYLRWRRALRANGTLPDALQVRNTRRLVMVQAHILPLVPMAAVFMARGFGK
jgi:putative membrane protein